MPHDEVHPLRERVPVTSDGSTDVDVRTDPVEAGWHWLVTHYAVEDETTAFTSVRAFVESGAYPYLLEEELVPPAAVLFHGAARQLLGEGDRFGARFNGTTNNDLLRLYVHGWMIPPGVPVTPTLLLALMGGGAPDA